jgi:uncharacterized protein (DUF885 family)
MLDRRQMIAALAASASPLPAPAPPVGPQLTALLDTTMRRLLESSPQLLTVTGLDTGADAAARSRLDDRSPAGLAQTRDIFVDLKAALARWDPKTLRGVDRINHQTAAYLADTTLESFGFSYGDPYVGPAIPYIVSQLSGAYRSVPAFLANQHPLQTAADAEAYLARLAAFAVLLDQESDRLRRDFAKGVVPPDFVLKTTLIQFAELTAPAPAESQMAGALERQTRQRGIPGDWRSRAAKIVTAEVYPALRRQAAILQAAVPTATSDAGVWRLPQGEAYYRYAVRAATTTDLSGDDIHRLGLDLVASLTARADAILRAWGLTTGTVAQRVATLRRDPAQLYADSEAGRAALLADLQRMVDAMQTRLPGVFDHLPKAGLIIQRMSPAIEAGSSGATYQPPTLDSARPGLFSINLRNMAEWPRFDLPTLVYHEGIPGHHLQNALVVEADGLPLLRRLPLFSGYTEGWGLYAEQLADEMGAYDGDPLGQLGYVASMMFRAARLVLDSGIHHKRWTREQAITYMSATLGVAASSVAREIERYCAQPAQAASYMLGWRVWTDARARAKARLGARFDIRRFHDLTLLKGDMPLDVLARVIDDWSGA